MFTREIGRQISGRNACGRDQSQPYLVSPTLRLPESPFRRQGEKITVGGGTRMSGSHKQGLSCHRNHILVSDYGNRRNSDPIRNVHAQILLAAPTYIHTLSWVKNVSACRLSHTGAGGEVGRRAKEGKGRSAQLCSGLGTRGRYITRTERALRNPGEGDDQRIY